jgi:prevent-host-death family protein
MSEARKHLSTIVDEVLAKYPRVVIEKRGKPVAVISPPDDVKDVVVTEEF